jgi:hypothetical protein
MANRSDAKKSISALLHVRSGCDMLVSFLAGVYLLQVLGKRVQFSGGTKMAR